MGSVKYVLLDTLSISRAMADLSCPVMGFKDAFNHECNAYLTRYPVIARYSGFSSMEDDSTEFFYSIVEDAVYTEAYLKEDYPTYKDEATMIPIIFVDDYEIEHDRAPQIIVSLEELIGSDADEIDREKACRRICKSHCGFELNITIKF